MNYSSDYAGLRRGLLEREWRQKDARAGHRHEHSETQRKSGNRLCEQPTTLRPAHLDAWVVSASCRPVPASLQARQRFFRSSPNDRRTSGLTLVRRTTSPSGVTATTRHAGQHLFSVNAKSSYAVLSPVYLE